MLRSPFNHVNKWLLPALGRPLKWIERFQGKNKLPQARSSVGERHLDVVDVVGSIPSAPTKIKG